MRTVGRIELLGVGSGVGDEVGKLAGATIYYDRDVSEYCVRFFDARGRHYEPADYFTDCESDARDTARLVLRRS